MNTPDWITVTGVPYLLRLKSGLLRPRPPPCEEPTSPGSSRPLARTVADLEPGDEVFGSAWADTLATTGTFAGPHSRCGVQAHQARRTHLRGGRHIRHVGPDEPLIAIRDLGNVAPGTRVISSAPREASGRSRSRSQRHSVQKSPACAAPADLELVGHSARITSSATRRRTSRAASSATTSSSATSMNHPPSATARVLTPAGSLVPRKQHREQGGFWAGLPRLARATLIGQGSTDVQFHRHLVVNRGEPGSLRRTPRVPVTSGWSSRRSTRSAKRRRGRSPTCWDTMPEARSPSPCSGDRVSRRDFRGGHRGHVAGPRRQRGQRPVGTGLHGDRAPLGRRAATSTSWPTTTGSRVKGDLQRATTIAWSTSSGSTTPATFSISTRASRRSEASAQNPARGGSSFSCEGRRDAPEPPGP